MRALFQQAVTVMENAFRRLEAQVPAPRKKPCKDGFVFRYAEQTIEQALIQKLARIISGLRAVDVLLIHGYVQEQGVLHRTLDELNEDIMFLTVAITNDQVTELHERYLKAFWEEEFDIPDDPVGSTQKRDTPPRKKIRAYITRTLGEGIDLDPSKQHALGETLSKTYSGFVHGASPHIMDMCGGDPPRFHLSGMKGTVRIDESVDDAWNYFYRSLLSVMAVTKALGDKVLLDALYQYRAKFERDSGKDFEGKERIAVQLGVGVGRETWCAASDRGIGLATSRSIRSFSGTKDEWPCDEADEGHPVFRSAAEPC